ncbi:urease accessory protein UreE [Prochlorococcus sp. MIT 1223]|uniref:urease accessory protein UreE n=1 Tax=Prochlorococcus sp. MIT 1223 TaxID=3096217 RepID=UPI002A75CB7D|nr:urease accessory protein UreE [Prochlorococcus sp. MIT 1223]
MSETLIYLTERTSTQANENCLILSLSAKERGQLRGKRSTLNGIEVILNLPRGGGRLIPGEVLKSEDSLFYVTIEAAKEDLIKVSSDNRLKLLKAAYHLGNRHVEIEFHERDIYLLNDVVMRKMLEQQGFEIEFAQVAFSPEIGAYT